MGEENRPDASGQDLTEEQERTTQDPQVEVTHLDAFARKQYDAPPTDPEAQGAGNNPTEAQGGVGQKTEDLELDPSQGGGESASDDEEE